jgi:hypothetical protein
MRHTSARAHLFVLGVVVILGVVRSARPALAHQMPANIDAANGELPARQRNIIRAWAQQHAKPENNFSFGDWGEGALRQIAAGNAVFAGGPIWQGAESERRDLEALLAGPDAGASEEEQRTAWAERLTAYIPSMVQRYDVGTDHFSKWCKTVDPDDQRKNKECGNYDFVLAAAISVATMFRDAPEVVPNDVILQLLTHGQVEFWPSGEWKSGHLPFSGQVPAEGPDGLILGVPGHPTYVRDYDLAFPRWVAKTSTPETENHVLGMYAWRYLAQNYLEWAAHLPAEHPRYDTRLVSLYWSDPVRYTNGPELTELVLRILNRFLHYGAFETNAKTYESISVQALLAIASYAGVLFPADQARQNVQTAAQIALDYLAAEFAFQSFEGKRVPPLRRRYPDQRSNVHPYANTYVPHMFGVLTGAYVFDDSLSLEEAAVAGIPHEIHSVRSCTAFTPPALPGLVCDCSSLADATTFHCDATNECTEIVNTSLQSMYVLFGACQCECDSSFHPACVDCGDAPYMHVGQEAGYALWAALSDYRVPAPIHDLMLNKHSGYWARLQSKYFQHHYPVGVKVLISETGEPDNPFAAWPVYGPAPNLETALGFRPVSQYYFATSQFLNSAGGKNLDYYPEQCGSVGADDKIFAIGLTCLLGPLFCEAGVGIVEGLLPLCQDRDILHAYDVMSRPYTVIGKGRLGKTTATDVTALRAETLVMAGQTNTPGDVASSKNLDTYKGFSYGYSHYDNDDESQHTSFPMTWPSAWNAYRLPEAVLDRGVFEFFDFTTAPTDHPLYGNYLIVSRVSKSYNLDRYRTYARGFWEIVPGSRFTSGNEFRSAVLRRNPVSNYNDVTDSYYYYTMTTGERVTMHPLVGSSFTDKGILEIRAADGTVIPEGMYRFDLNARSQPLIEVWQLDQNSDFTGRELALAPGDGTLTIDNCYLGQAWVADASDYLNPHRAPVDSPRCTDQLTGSKAPIAWYVASPTDVTVTDGGMSVWHDRSGNGNDVTQSFYYGRPQFNATGWNANKPTVTFDGGDLMRLDTWSAAPSGPSPSFTVLAVMRAASPQDSAVAGWWSPVGAGATWAGLKPSNGQTLPQLTRLDGIAAGQLYTGSVDIGTGRHVVAWRYSADAEVLKLTVDGFTTESPYLSPIADVAAMPFIMGAKSLLPTGLFTGDISELMIIPASLSDLEVADFTVKAQNTWGGLSTLDGANPCVDGNGQPSDPSVRCEDGDPATVGDHCANSACVGTIPPIGSPGTLNPSLWYYAAPSEVEMTDFGVAKWFDRSPNQRDLTQLFYLGRPVYAASSWNPSKPTLQFNGNKLLRYEGWTGAPTGDDGAFTVLAVVTSTSTQAVGVASWWNANSAGRVWCELTPGNGTIAAELLRQDDYGIQDLRGPSVGAGPHVVVWRYTPGPESLTVSVDGNVSTQSGLTPLGPIAPDAFLVGAATYLPTGLLNGEISELAVIPASISDDEITSFIAYARGEWGLP